MSVLIPVYNAGCLLRPCVESVLHEIRQHDEILLIDDGSTDGCIETVKDLPIRIIRKRKNAGAALALNAGLRATRGKLVTFLDADDLLAPGSIQWRAKYLKQKTRAQAVGGRPAGVIDSHGKSIRGMKHLLHPKFKAPQKITFEFIQGGGLYPTEIWNFMFRKSLLMKIGRFRSAYKIAYDVDFFMRVLKQTEIPIVFKPTVFRRLHTGNLSMNRKNHSARLSCQLKPQTIRECRAIYAKLGLRMTNTQPWLLSYGL